MIPRKYSLGGDIVSPTREDWIKSQVEMWDSQRNVKTFHMVTGECSEFLIPKIEEAFTRFVIFGHTDIGIKAEKEIMKEVKRTEKSLKMEFPLSLISHLAILLNSGIAKEFPCWELVLGRKQKTSYIIIFANSKREFRESLLLRSRRFLERINLKKIGIEHIDAHPGICQLREFYADWKAREHDCSILDFRIKGQGQLRLFLGYVKDGGNLAKNFNKVSIPWERRK